MMPQDQPAPPTAGGAGAGGISPPGMDAPDSGPRPGAGSGGGGGISPPGMSAPGGAGMLGPGPPGSGMMGPGGPQPGMGGAGGAAAGNANPNSLGAGMTYLGEGTLKELTDEAAKQGLDVLIFFEVTVSQNVKTNLVNNETRIVIRDVGAGEDIEKSKDLNNITIQKARAEDKKEGDDPVTAALDKIFKALDEDGPKRLKVKDFPAEIRPEHVERRVAAILAKEGAEPLPALAEIKFFHHRGLISDGQLEKAYQKVLGEADGSKLATGTEDERIEVVSTLLPHEK